MKSLGTLFVVSILSFILAAGILGFCMVGPMGFVGAPIIACFGWFYFPFVFIGYGVALIWWKRTTMSRKSFCLLLPICAAGVFAVVGVKEQGSLVQSILGNVLGAFISGVIGLLVLTNDQKRESNNPAQSTGKPAPDR